MSTTLPRELCCKFYKLTCELGCLFSNLEECNRGGCMIISSGDYNILCTGVSRRVYNESGSKKKMGNNNGCKDILYCLSEVEDMITKISKLGSVSLEETIAITSRCPSLCDIKLLIESGVKALVTVSPRVNTNDTTNYIECLNKLMETCEIILLDKHHSENNLLTHNLLTHNIQVYDKQWR